MNEVLALADPGLGDDSIKFKARIQPRADFGESQLDLYLRRSCLEASGRQVDGVNYVLAVAGDHLANGVAAGSVVRVQPW